MSDFHYDLRVTEISRVSDIVCPCSIIVDTKSDRKQASCDWLCKLYKSRDQIPYLFALDVGVLAFISRCEVKTLYQSDKLI